MTKEQADQLIAAVRRACDLLESVSRKVIVQGVLPSALTEDERRVYFAFIRTMRDGQYNTMYGPRPIRPEPDLPSPVKAA